ncbi:hypothetical protein BFP70_11620 [Thioclava sp. SK-1]|uniref:AraC family transcriptional regulator n=1 Tax=Thioclava sp. SK-1 TaxID=1889770 RepID=UPI000824CA31|nr:helix-turn-helix transcriptional regulator [Thioclava sp. SK-1]OCX64653.1 hypothetical protein BFP70_11620 [Thioclava sp. SK-1]
MSSGALVSLANRIALVEQSAAAVISLASDYPEGTWVAPHSHPRDQLLHALSGVVDVSTEQGNWRVPPETALWIPAGCVHAVEMLGPVRMRSVYVKAGHVTPATGLRTPQVPRVVSMSPLARALVLETIGIGNRDCLDRREQLVLDLLLHEIPRLPEQPLALPLPRDPRLLRLCQAFIADPCAQVSLDGWAAQAAMSRRSLSRHFRQETGLTLDRWRQQACVMAALPRLVRGDPITQIALDLGYDSPAAFTTMFRRLLGVGPRAYAQSGAT